MLALFWGISYSNKTCESGMIVIKYLHETNDLELLHVHI